MPYEAIATYCVYSLGRDPAANKTDPILRRMTTDRRPDAAWRQVRERLHAEGLRWTPQRRTLVEVLSHVDGHVTGADLVERCRALDPTTTPSTVYRTLDVLEDLGYVSHHHGIDGREEYHVLPTDGPRSPALPTRAAARGRSNRPRPMRSPACSRRSGRSRSTAPTSRSPGSAPGARTQRKWRGA